MIIADLELYDPDAVITLQQKHLNAINYLLESNVRPETTLLDVHHQHLQNAREVIMRALRVDAPNRPLTGLIGVVGVPNKE